MNWYLAKTIYQILNGNGNHAAQFDEQLRLIEATDLQQAILKAEQTGKQKEHSFINQKSNFVQWKFIAVTELYPLLERTDGAEMFSRIYEPEDESAYLDAINKKSASLQSGQSMRLAEV